jgi:hypothetical protein
MPSTISTLYKERTTRKQTTHAAVQMHTAAITRKLGEQQKHRAMTIRNDNAKIDIKEKTFTYKTNPKQGQANTGMPRYASEGCTTKKHDCLLYRTASFAKQRPGTRL